MSEIQKYFYLVLINLGTIVIVWVGTGVLLLFSSAVIKFIRYKKPIRSIYRIFVHEIIKVINRISGHKIWHKEEVPEVF